MSNNDTREKQSESGRTRADGWKFELAQVKRKLLQEKGRENKLGRGKVLSNNDKTNTRKEIASDLGWSTGKVAQAEQVWDKGDDETREREGEAERSF